MLATFCSDTTSVKATTLTNSGSSAHYVALFDSMLCSVMAALNRDLSDHRFIKSSAENNQQGDVWKYSPSYHKETVQSDN